MTDLQNTDEDRKAEIAFEVHQALVKAECANPALKQNPYWNAIRTEAYDSFCRAFDGEWFCD